MSGFYGIYGGTATASTTLPEIEVNYAEPLGTENPKAL
jgi:hypothetical protein